MSSILPLTSALSGAANNSRFMAITLAAPDCGQFLFNLTPRVMAWSSNTYLLDLQPVYQYWSHLAQMRELSVIEYLSALISELAPTETRATLAAHPWQAIILLSAVSGRPSLNFIDAQSYLGRRALQDVTWIDWITHCHELREHLMSQADNKQLKKSHKDGVSSLATLAKTVSRLQFTHIAQMSDIDQLSMQRRFGKLAATAWKWTWQVKPSDASSLFEDIFADDFPWSNIRPTETPKVSRCLETSLREWDHMEPLLREDLDKICKLDCWSSSERVVSLEWELSFSCSPSLRIPVLFRHPHPLHRESGHHKTALLQAFHSWQKALLNKNKPQSAGESYISDDSVVEWTLTISERLPCAPVSHSIFSEDLAKDPSKLQNLENSLGVSLVEFSPTDHWAPERSYMQTNSLQINGSPLNHASIGSVPTEQQSASSLIDNLGWMATNQRRPLFIYSASHPPTNGHQSSGLIFSERVTTAWWSKTPEREASTCRNYYIRMTDDGLLQWVFPNDDGSLRVHGIFG